MKIEKENGVMKWNNGEIEIRKKKIQKMKWKKKEMKEI